jgi:DinB superfamily
MTITPDDKDWTWVLQRPCPDCGFVAAKVRAADVADQLEDVSAAFIGLLHLSDVAARRRPEMWSPLEYACHVRDVFRLYDYRLHLMLDEVDPRFPNWDQDVTAVEERYGDQDPRVVAHELRDAQRTLSDSFRAVTDDQWLRRGFRSDGAEFTIDSFARYLIHDPIHHLWDVGSQPASYSEVEMRKP